MNAGYDIKRCKFRRFASLALLLSLFVAQSYLAAHSADFGAHDDELCETCLGSGSSNKTIALGTSLVFARNIAVESFGAHTDSLHEASADASCRAIRAPPLSVKS